MKIKRNKFIAKPTRKECYFQNIFGYQLVGTLTIGSVNLTVNQWVVIKLKWILPSMVI
jgi:hypothetical protein